MKVAVLHYDADRVPNPNPNGDTPFEDFWEVRGSLLAASQRFGATGPESKDSPRYWIVEDQYNDELYQYMEVYEPNAWRADWLLALIAVLGNHSGWGIGISVYEGYVVVFADRLMVTGPTFAGCKDLESVVIAAREATERLHQRKYGPLKRQLAYVKTLLPKAMRFADANGFAYLATFDRYELHESPAIWLLRTKRELRLDPVSASCRSTAVTADGEIHPEYCPKFWPYTEVIPPYWLETYLVEDRLCSSFRLIDEDENQVALLKVDRVIVDDELVRFQESGTRSEH